ncbi:helix-turn-helix domain-containing protein [Streptomyces malaysiensis]|uniref:helix-turn-helix domain-containing protein n=1 Tax=Streptomyces malaysiensis TaxID=92644 RepID=UPI0011CD8860|nr:helix-turn-helix domain-containing protein [Streptomyces malaysiensis]
MARQAPRPVTEADYDAVRRLAAKGKGRNEIAREIGRSSRTVSEIAAKLDPPVSFDRTATAVATEARKADAKARRLALIHRAYSRVEKLYERLEADEHDGYKFTATTVNGIETKMLDHVPGQEEKAVAAAIGQHLTQAAKLEAVDGSSDEEDAKSMLGKIMGGLATVWNEQQAAGEGDGDAP